MCKTKNNPESINVLLETTRLEYEKEYQRIALIENKASISLPIIGGYFFALIKEVTPSSFNKINFSTFTDFLASVFLENSYCLSLVTVLIAIILVALILKPAKYKAMVPNDFNKDCFLQKEPSNISLEIIKKYIFSIEKNRKKNKQRAYFYLSGWIFAVFSLIMFMIYKFI